MAMADSAGWFIYWVPEPQQVNTGSWWVGWELLGLGSVEMVLAVG